MRRPVLLLLAGAALAAAPRAARAQAFSANAHGVVATVVSLARLNDLAFGATAITPGVLTSVTPANGARLRVDYNEPASVTSPSFVMLSGPGGAQLRVDLVCAQATTAANPSPTPFTGPCAGGFVTPISGSVGGTHYVYIGGTVTGGSSSAAVAGSYAGSVTVTAAFVVY